MNYELTGTLHKVANTQQITDTFKKRDFSVKTDEQYPQVINFQLVQDKVSELDKISLGAQVTVSFNLRGKEFADKSTGEMKSITNLQAWKITAAQSEQESYMAAAAPQPQQATPLIFDSPEDNLPF